MSNRIWIELDEPKSKDHAEEQCRLANNMLRKLGVAEPIGFWWFERKRRYCFTQDVVGGYKELTDRGEWLNLDFLGCK